ncbi:hypothetical protein RSOL_457000 [Rhizoctonia solani AG-3 Rhs1AP]|uniref:Uncharacterized protein n=1 Tax=Rhizoctonia solani AG-3 Rhs1AP TaxID=1086054 RepID=X8JGG6_9AGAM|nr:hypothetical protein RSOL_457000 [Rhizoctonia solani AG-3 Rhs1AP]
MENLCTGNARVNRLSTLAQAADCLAKAAITLSEAARAAAESFSSELLDIPAVFNSLSEETPGYELGGDERGDEERTNPDDQNTISLTRASPRSQSEPSRCNLSLIIIGTILYHRAPQAQCPLINYDLIQIDILPLPPSRQRSKLSPAWHIMEQEADVLLFVCALIQHRRKVICYMNCSIPTFHMYRRFINDVTATNVHTITKTTTAEITQVEHEFLEDDHSILLLPETTTPSIEIDEVDSWVIHVGWPSDEQRYEEQRLIHQAQNSIIVACSEDEELYPAGAAVMWQSQPWPGDIDSFRVSVALLRPIFDKKLSLLPAEMKAKVYPDWISSHGPRGHRHVGSWDAITLVKRANSFLLDVLKYKPPGSKNSGSSPQIFLPEVSEGFVAHNGLELAVSERVLRVKPTDSGLNHLSSLPTDDWAEPDVLDWAPEPGSANNFESTPGETYFAVDEEFDAIPLICFLATSCAPTLQKVVLFVNFSGCRTEYRTLIERITGWRVFAYENEENGPSNKEVMSDFVQSREPAILILHLRVRTLSALENVPLGYCIYWPSTLSTSGGTSSFGAARKHQTSLSCEFTSIIIPTAEVSKRPEGSSFREHPSSADLLHPHDSPWLSDIRTKVRLVLSGNPQIAKSLYETHLKIIAKNYSHLGAEGVARRINKFTANVLLMGEAEDGSKEYPPIAGRPMISSSIVHGSKLQAAVDAGLLYVYLGTGYYRNGAYYTCTATIPARVRPESRLDQIKFGTS